MKHAEHSRLIQKGKGRKENGKTTKKLPEGDEHWLSRARVYTHAGRKQSSTWNGTGYMICQEKEYIWHGFLFPTTYPHLFWNLDWKLFFCLVCKKRRQKSTNTKNQKVRVRGVKGRGNDLLGPVRVYSASHTDRCSGCPRKGGFILVVAAAAMVQHNHFTYITTCSVRSCCMGNTIEERRTEGSSQEETNSHRDSVHRLNAGASVAASNQSGPSAHCRWFIACSAIAAAAAAQTVVAALSGHTNLRTLGAIAFCTLCSKLCSQPETRPGQTHTRKHRENNRRIGNVLMNRVVVCLALSNWSISTHSQSPAWWLEDKFGDHHNLAMKWMHCIRWLAWCICMMMVVVSIVWAC